MSTIYETWFRIYDETYYLIFQTLYDNGGYINFGLSFILIPLLFWILFYKVWNYPYGKRWHWVIWLVITIVAVASVTYGVARIEIFAPNDPSLIEALDDSSSGYKEYAETLPLKYSGINSLLTLIISFVYSFILKQFSKIQPHLPF